MAALLMRKAMKPQVLLAQPKISRPKAIAFLNASYLCGWLNEAESMVTLPASATSGGSSSPNFLDRIRFRLGMQAQA
jgi:hypothetical protein